MVFHLKLNDGKSLEISRTPLNILDNFENYILLIKRPLERMKLA